MYTTRRHAWWRRVATPGGGSVAALRGSVATRRGSVAVHRGSVGAASRQSCCVLVTDRARPIATQAHNVFVRAGGDG